ncbi:MAG: orotidine-5'-phosphate decarboxylase [Gemmatimonadaceae bacterium]|nr:orotidine-5'-phosphate decarboxylase [Gemmatimonadaceae bacterium]
MAVVTGGAGDAALRAIPIVALDFPDSQRAMTLVQTLDQKCRFYKVGSELFTAVGPEIIQWLRDFGCDVFLDLKFHDIPNTVAGAMRRVADMEVRLATVHASGGMKMMEAAVAAAGSSCGVLAVTVLTSLDDESLGAAWGRQAVDVADEVLRLATAATESGAHGIVCSGREAEVVRRAHGDALKLLIPGIRLAGDPSDDQARVVTPEAAARSGASYVVLGRAVTAAKDPRVAMDAVNRQLEGASE